MISGQRVLCAASPHLGHAVPLAALALEFQNAGNEVAVITDYGALRDFYQNLGLKCLDLRAPSSSTWQALSMMLSVVSDWDPDITICDWRRDLWLVQQVLRPRCRISILRCENFIGYVRRSPFLPDKYVLNSPEEVDFLRRFNRPPASDPRLLYRTEMIVVPSMPDFDPPPPYPERDYPNSEFLYTGPLMVDGFDPLPDKVLPWVALQRNAGKPIVLVTTGTAWGREFCTNLVESIDRARFSCILAVPKQPASADVARYTHPSLLIVEGASLRALAPQSDVVVHHCGHGTFQTVILAGKPSITIPSYHYDREDNALRLEDLGCSIHLDDGLYRRGLNIDRLNDAVERVLHDDKIAAATSAMCRKLCTFAAQRGPSQVLRTLEGKELVSARKGRSPARRLKRSYSIPRFPSFLILAHALREKLRFGGQEC